MSKENELRAADLMTSDVATVGPDTPLRRVVLLLAVRHITGLPVVDGTTGALLGMITEGDLVRWYEERLAEDAVRAMPAALRLAPAIMHALRDSTLTVADAMPPGPAETVSEEMRLGEIAHLMHEKGIKRFPVVRNGRLVGIISRSDVVRGLAFALEDAEEARRLTDAG